MTVSLCIRQGSKRNDDSVSVEELDWSAESQILIPAEHFWCDFKCRPWAKHQWLVYTVYGYSNFRHFQNCCNRDGNIIFKSRCPDTFVHKVYIPFKYLGLVRCLKKKSLQLIKAAILWSIIQWNCEILLQFKILHFKMFSTANTPVFSVTGSFRNHSNMLICCLKAVSYHQCRKQLLLSIFCGNCDTLFDE